MLAMPSGSRASAVTVTLRVVTVTSAGGVVTTAKLVVLWSDPLGVVTVIDPAIAPVGMLVVICVADATLNVALTPANWTLVAPVKPVPVIVTAVPIAPLLGEKLLTTGGAGGGVVVTVKLVGLASVPAGVVTVIVAVGTAPAGTLVVILVSELTVKVAVTAPNLTLVAPVKPVPVKVTVVPTGPLVGAKLATTGGDGGVTPPGVVRRKKGS